MVVYEGNSWFLAHHVGYASETLAMQVLLVDSAS